MTKFKDEIFIPATMEREIGDNIVFRPRRAWHSGIYAGERLYQVDGDGSGCLRRGNDLCNPPLSVTHRLYWHKSNPSKIISSFLSYPNGMGACDEYFWEIYPAEDGDIERFSSELEMEKAIIKILKDTKE